MPEATVVEWIREKYVAIAADLDERGRRRWSGAEARSLGWGGVAAVAEATGISDRTIRTGIRELDDPNAAPSHKQRRPGGGRQAREIEQPKLIKALEALVEPDTRGDPCSPLRWTCKSTRTLARELTRQGYQVSSTKIGQLLRTQGYSLQANRKTIEGKQHPDRDAQFEHINKRVVAFLRTGQPAISIDTKKKEPLGNMKNAGQTYRPKGNPTKVTTHDFPDRELGKAVPYGVYDIALNEAGVSVGVSHDTAEFAVAAIDRWWKRMGEKRYPAAKRLLITADCGGSNSPRTRLWRWALQQFANRTGLKIELCHYPPGTSKWNKIEHRLFCHITRNWRGVPLECHEIVVNLIGSTSTEEGLEVHAWLDKSKYEKSKKVSDERLAEVQIKRNTFHGEWNYQILPVM
ncbi:Transposase and inactivated derivatives [hydrothermal vent metagenome]|uniref:Transposase and inactivated derivatives n=1 Tax=hydrothermal vent metagenome TaxID=652676 RepID=A0A3B1BJ31_9ZZZZ